MHFEICRQIYEEVLEGTSRKIVFRWNQPSPQWKDLVLVSLTAALSIYDKKYRLATLERIHVLQDCSITLPVEYF